MNEQQIHRITMFFNRLPGLWWLNGEALRHWITHRELEFYIGWTENPTPHIVVTCSCHQIEMYSLSRNVDIIVDNNSSKATLKFGDRCVIVSCNQKADNTIVATEENKNKLKRRSDLTSDGLWRRNISEVSPVAVQLPFKYGTVLDNWKPLWWKDQDHTEYTPLNKPIWFTPERKQSGYELLRLMLECAERAKMRDAMWLGFGNLLGYIMFGDFVKHDNDMDMCIQMDRSTPEKDRRYLEEIKKPFKIGKQHFPHGLTEKMFRASSRTADNRPLWISIGHRSIDRDNGVKSCHWWMFEHSNHYWHSKGDRWVTNAKFPNFQINQRDQAVCIGQPSGTLSSFTEVNFHGVAVNMPTKAGTCCDWWYPGWVPDGSGSSSHRRILAIPDWNNKATWRMG